MKTVWGIGVIAPPFVTSALDGGVALPLYAHWMGGWVGPRAGVEVVKKDFLPPSGIKPQYL
jgi:hypothetical protein